jgi:hypothetical protein
MRPSTWNTSDLIVATGTVFVSLLTTALYVAELATRPAPDAAWTITTSVN